MQNERQPLRHLPGSNGFEHAWRERFEEFANAHDDDAGIAGWKSAGLAARVRQFLLLWNAPAASGRWLDAGCGAGTYSRVLRQLGLEVVGTDYSVPTLRKASQRDFGNVMYAAADVRRLPFRNGSFDGALCLGVTQALARSDDAVRALAAVVRPGGELWVDALNRWCLVNLYDTLRRRLRGRQMHLRYESSAVLTQAMRACGVGDVRLHWLPLLPARFKRFQRWVECPAARWVFRIVPLAGPLFCHAFIASGILRGRSEAG